MKTALFLMAAMALIPFHPGSAQASGLHLSETLILNNVANMTINGGEVLKAYLYFDPYGLKDVGRHMAQNTGGFRYGAYIDCNQQLLRYSLVKVRRLRKDETVRRDGIHFTSPEQCRDALFALRFAALNQPFLPIQIVVDLDDKTVLSVSQISTDTFDN